MKKRAPLAATLLTLFIPFYQIYWFYVTAKDMQSRGAKVPSNNLLFAPYALMVLMLIMLFAGSAAAASTEASGGTATGFALGLFLLFPLLVGLILYYEYKFSEAAEHVTNGKVSKVIGFVLFLFVGPAAVYIIQDALNENANTKSPASAAAPKVS